MDHQILTTNSFAKKGRRNFQSPLRLIVYGLGTEKSADRGLDLVGRVWVIGTNLPATQYQLSAAEYVDLFLRLDYRAQQIRTMANNTPANTSPFMLLFRNAGEESHQHLTPAQRTELTKKWNDWYEELSTKGKVQHGRPLELGGRVVSGVRGERVVDGPYAEAKEAVGGYLFLTVADLDEATAIAKQCPGLVHGLIVEVRPVADVSPMLEGVQGHGPGE